MNYELLLREDYEGEVKLQDARIACYTPKQMKKLYPQEDYRLVAETKAKNKKKVIGRLKVSEDDGPLKLSNPGTYGKLFWKRAGYVSVGGDEYIALLKFRAAFLILLLGLGAALLITAGVLLWLLFGPKDTAQPTPEIDRYVEPLGDGVGGESPDDGSGSVSMIYTLQANLNLSTGNISIYFKNPARSNHDVSLELYVFAGGEPIKIAESGIIEPGYGLSTMTFDTTSVSLSEGDYEARYKVIYYNTKTGERALMESDINDLRLSVSP